MREIKINLIKIIVSLAIALGSVIPAYCTDLPINVINYIKKEVPGAKVRFDGLIELPDATNYLPVLPLVFNQNVTTLEVTQTIPAGKQFSQKPDMLLFNNNLALLRIIQKPGKSPTVTNSPGIPLKVKLGLLPQDLIVPRGLELPVGLKVILGDLKIPLNITTDTKSEILYQSLTRIDEFAEKPVAQKTTAQLPTLDFLSDKKLYALDHRANELKLLNSCSGRPEKTINLPSIPFNMALSDEGRYILLTTPALNSVLVVDTFNNEFVKTLDVGKLPSSVYSSLKLHKAFVANGQSSSISEIDLKQMRTTREISVIGYPDNLQAGDDANSLFYNDRLSGKVYQLNLTTNVSQELTQIDSISKLEPFANSLFILSRSENALVVYNIKTGEVIKRIPTGEKPLDFLILQGSGKILVVCAGSDEIDVVDMEKLEVTKTVPLNSGSFPGGITAVKGKDIALINAYDGYEIIIYNIKTELIEGQIPVSETLSKIIVSDK